MQPTPSKAEFLRLAAEHSLIPVYVDLPVDLETPVSLYYKIVGDEPGFMLESAETSKNFGRYSFIGVEPFLVVEAHKNGLELKSDAGCESIKKAPLKALQDILNRFSFADLPGLPPFSGGAVGNIFKGSKKAALVSAI